MISCTFCHSSLDIWYGLYENGVCKLRSIFTSYDFAQPNSDVLVTKQVRYLFKGFNRCSSSLSRISPTFTSCMVKDFKLHSSILKTLWFLKVRFHSQGAPIATGCLLGIIDTLSDKFVIVCCSVIFKKGFRNIKFVPFCSS